MSKTVVLSKRPSRATPEAVDRWMAGTIGAPELPPAAPAQAAPAVAPRPSSPAPKMKRLTIDIPEELHRRVKGRCGQSGMKICEVIREMLESRFPAEG